MKGTNPKTQGARWQKRQTKKRKQAASEEEEWARVESAERTSPKAKCEAVPLAKPNFRQRPSLKKKSKVKLSETVEKSSRRQGGETGMQNRADADHPVASKKSNREKVAKQGAASTRDGCFTGFNMFSALAKDKMKLPQGKSK